LAKLFAVQAAAAAAGDPGPSALQLAILAITE
jgi:hypothetical protein